VSYGKKNYGSVNAKFSHKLRGFNIDKKVQASTQFLAELSVKFFAAFGSKSVQLNNAVFRQNQRFVMRYKLNQTAPNNGYCKGRQRQRERISGSLTYKQASIVG